MAVDTDTVRQMAKLARIHISDSEINSLASEMGSILDFMSEIAQWDGEENPGARPTLRREDIVLESTGSQLIEAAAAHQDGQVIVPPIKGAS